MVVAAGGVIIAGILDETSVPFPAVDVVAAVIEVKGVFAPVNEK